QRLLGAVRRTATRGDPRSVVRAIDDFCRHTEWAMNVGDEKGCILDSVVSEVSPATVLELGTYCGYSTVRIATLLPPGAKLITLEFNPDFALIARQVIAWAGLEEKVHLVEGSSGDLIPLMKEKFGVKSFDLVFLDHWKDRYLPDTKLLEAGFTLLFPNALSQPLLLTFLSFSGMWPSPERQRPAGRQRHLSRKPRLPGIHPQQPQIQEPAFQVPPGVHQSGRRPGEICVPGLV
ncbi:unnamed protein product, partial [Tetraodon nigroviridis]